MQNFFFSSTNYEKELARVNREIYERNVELAIRNRTFLILSKIYTIINASFGLHETAAKLIDAIVAELKFQKGFIALVDKEKKMLKAVAATPLSPEQKVKTSVYTLRQ